jgi:transcriptional regulator with XRE-family HTH domain
MTTELQEAMARSREAVAAARAARAEAVRGVVAELARQLRAARQAAGLTQQDVADAVGIISRNQVTNIENRERGMSVEALVSMAATVGLRVTLVKEDWFAPDEGDGARR